MKKVNTDHLPCLHMLVFSPLTSICNVVKYMISAHVVTHKLIHGAMVNASGSWLDADQLISMYQSQDTTNYAIASFLQTLHSAMVLINICLNGYTTITEVSGDCGVLSHSGAASVTGLSLSTSEQNIHTNNKFISHQSSQQYYQKCCKKCRCDFI